MMKRIFDINGKIFNFPYEFNFKDKYDIFNSTHNAKQIGDKYKIIRGTFASPIGEFTKDEVLRKITEGEWYELRILDYLH